MENYALKNHQREKIVPKDWKLSFFVVYLKVKEVFTVYRLKILRDQVEMNEHTKMKASTAIEEDVKFDKY